MSESANLKPKGAGGSTKGAWHHLWQCAEWRTLLAEFFASPCSGPSGQQAESFSFVLAKNH